MDCVDKCGGEVDLSNAISRVRVSCGGCCSGGGGIDVYVCKECGRLHFHCGDGVSSRAFGKAYWDKDKSEIFHKNENDSN